MKKCSLCKIIKDFKYFGVKSKNSKYNSWCKACVILRTSAHKHTITGLVQQIYRFQLTSSIRRKHAPPEYTREWLYSWIIKQPNFIILYNNWVNSNYTKNKIPSVDRLNDNLNYTKKNIQLLTWEANDLKGRSAYLNGKIGRKVNQLDLENNLVKKWPNTSMPANHLSCTMGEITRVCKGKRNTCRGYKWEYQV